MHGDCLELRQSHRFSIAGAMTTVSNVDSTPWTPSLLPRRTIEMVQSPSDHFITLIATLLEALPDDGSSSELLPNLPRCRS